jgi:hypothetical protein
VPEQKLGRGEEANGRAENCERVEDADEEGGNRWANVFVNVRHPNGEEGRRADAVQKVRQTKDDHKAESAGLKIFRYLENFFIS